MALSANLLAAPVAAPLLTAALILLLARWGGRRWIRQQIALTALALCLNLAVALLLFQATAAQGERFVLQMGAWSAPFGITVYGDGLSATLLLLTALVALAVYPFAVATIDYHRERMGFHPLYLLLLMGVNGAFLAGDLFNLYVFFEVLLMASFVLLTVGAQPAQTNSGIRYVVLNLLASTVFLVAAGVAYGTLGTLNMAQIAQRLPLASPAVRTLFAGLLLVGFGSKAAIFPLFFWLPASYHTPPPAVTALFGGLLTKVGVYTLFRSYTLFFPELLIEWQQTLLTIAGATMLVGALGALAQPGIRRLLSFHIISHVGFMLMGLAVALSGNTFGYRLRPRRGRALPLPSHDRQDGAHHGGRRGGVAHGQRQAGFHRRAGDSTALSGLSLFPGCHLFGRCPAFQRIRQQTEPVTDHAGYTTLAGFGRQCLCQLADDDQYDASLARVFLGRIQAPKPGPIPQIAEPNAPLADTGPHRGPCASEPGSWHSGRASLSADNAGGATGARPSGLY